MTIQQLKQNTTLPKQDIHAVHLCNVSLAPINEVQCVKWIAESINSGYGGWCVTINLEILRRITKQPSLRYLIASSTLRVADGITLVWASCLQGTPLPERVCGSNLIYSLTREVRKYNKSIFLLGGNPGTSERSAEQLRRKNPGLRIAGTLCPPIGFEHNPAQIQEIENLIFDTQPDIVYVALGTPKSELLIEQLRHRFPKIWWIGVGISFSYVCGDIKRPPRWAQNFGIETLYRLCQEPRRLAKRYLMYGPLFVTYLFTVSLIRRIQSLTGFPYVR